MERKPKQPSPISYLQPFREQPPYEPIDVDAFGFDPENNPNDRLRLAEARNDVWLLMLIDAKASLGEQHAARAAYPDYQDQMQYYGEQIQAREAFLAAQFSPNESRP